MITLPTEINLEEAHNLEAGFQQPFEIKNETEDRKATVAGIEFFTPVTEEHFEHYYVSSKGRFYNSKTKKILKPNVVKTGYALIDLSNNKPKIRKRFRTHRLIALAFIDNPEDLETVNHKDGNKLDNNVDNLEWMTQSDNAKHAWETGLITVEQLNTGKNRNAAKNKMQNNKNMIKQMRDEMYSLSSIANHLEVSKSALEKFLKEIEYTNINKVHFRESSQYLLQHLDEIENMLLEGCSYSSIAHKFGTSATLIKKIKKIYNLKESVAQAPQQDLDPKDTESIYENFVLGDSFTTLAHRCGLTSAGVACKLNNAYGKEHIQQVRKSRKSRNFKRN